MQEPVGFGTRGISGDPHKVQNCNKNKQLALGYPLDPTDSSRPKPAVPWPPEAEVHVCHDPSRFHRLIHKLSAWYVSD